MSLKAKQELVKRLFGPKLSKQGRDSHKLLDHSIYSYRELRAAYLEQVQLLHPDKHTSAKISTVEKEDNKRRFVDLQEAWNRYEGLAKIIDRASNGRDGITANFTLFGVGCSFSDNDAERTLRNEIMDQACRGWFSAGAIPCGEGDQVSTTGQKSRSTTIPVRLTDDGMFSQAHDDDDASAEQFLEHSKEPEGSTTPRPTLVANGIRYSSRKRD